MAKNTKAKAPTGPQVRVKVTGGVNPKTKELDGQPLHEDGVTYQPGEEFVLDADRADALGDLVEILGPVEAPAAPAS
ncbi:MAG: hypothetical protein P4L99_21695 [Chthoniobacter sp.]|nr:hypothetical protein [Chthoniobacter sp.]